MSEDDRTFLDGRVTLLAGDCLERLDGLPAASIDAVITDPPYHYDTIVERFGKEGSAPAMSNGATGIFARASAGFMGKQWDGGDIAFRPETWAKVLRVLKPGGHLAAFSAPKCVHKMGFAIELAGFEVRDRVPFLFDPDERVIAFLESLSAAQADALFRLFDTMGGLGEAFWTFGSGFPKSHDVAKAIDRHLGVAREKVRMPAAMVRNMKATGGGTDGMEGAARPFIEAARRNGFHEKDGETPATPEASEWQGWGTALKPAYEPIMIARKPLAERSVAAQVMATGTGGINVDAGRVGTEEMSATASSGVLISENESMAGGNYARAAAGTKIGRWPANLAHDGGGIVAGGFPDAAERFFYTAKADAHDRIGSGHPTVKPVDLMQWLCRMLCPPGGTVLDLFAGTGTTGEAAFREGFNAILIEREAEYRADIARRMEHATAGPVARRHAAMKAKAARARPSEPASVDDIFDLLGDGGGRP